MKTYVVSAVEGQSRPEILKMVRSAFLDCLEAEISDSLFSMAQDREDIFFLKTPSGILGGKVLFKPLAYTDGPALVREFDELAARFQQPFFPMVFLPKLESGKSFLEMVPKLRSFEYLILKSAAGPAVALREIVMSGAEPLAAMSRSISLSLQKGGDPGSRVQLTRSEISELIDLSLGLKGDKAV